MLSVSYIKRSLVRLASLGNDASTPAFRTLGSVLWHATQFASKIKIAFPGSDE